MTASATVQRTASGREQALVDFYRQLSRDGHTVTSLAEAARVGRAALTEIFNGKRRGSYTWKHVLPLLSPAALSLLKQCSAWNPAAEAELARLREREADSAALIALGNRCRTAPTFTQ